MPQTLTPTGGAGRATQHLSITATSLDDEQTIMDYWKGADSLQQLAALPNVRVAHGVDATTLDKVTTTPCPPLAICAWWCSGAEAGGGGAAAGGVGGGAWISAA